MHWRDLKTVGIDAKQHVQVVFFFFLFYFSACLFFSWKLPLGIAASKGSNVPFVTTRRCSSECRRDERLKLPRAKPQRRDALPRIPSDLVKPRPPLSTTPPPCCGHQLPVLNCPAGCCKPPCPPTPSFPDLSLSTKPHPLPLRPTQAPPPCSQPPFLPFTCTVTCQSITYCLFLLQEMCRVPVYKHTIF